MARLIAFGIPTNQMFLLACLRNPEFAGGRATTAFIAEQGAALVSQRDEAAANRLAALLLFITDPTAAPPKPGRSLAAQFPAALRFARGEDVIEIDVGRAREGHYVIGNGEAAGIVTVVARDGDTVRFRAGHGLARSAIFCRDGGQLHSLCEGVLNTVRDLTRVPPQAAIAEGGDGRVRAAMNGRVVAVLVKPGDSVSAGQPVLTLEAMKMEHVHAARAAGKVVAVHVAEGDQVTTGAVLIEVDSS